jgi:hypothetical protein
MTTRRNKKVAESKAYRFALVCAGKRFFETEAAALEAADVRMLENMRVTIGVYQCPTCMLWHLTSIRPDKKA